jgi:hypothetical protein
MVSLNFVGDIGLFKEYQIKMIDPFIEINLPDSDYNIGNFEFIIPNNRLNYFFDVSGDYAVDYDYFKSLKMSRFNAFSLANNHCMDYGKEGIEDVINIFKKQNISYFGVGSEGFNILRFELKGISFAIIACVKSGRWSRTPEMSFGPDPYDTDKVISGIKSLKNKVNHVIVFPHFGTELVDVPNPADVKNARLMIDNGASAVIGHHPHIIQGIEYYMNGLIAYSLGSFIYIPENEVGYAKSQDKNRDFSICLKLEFDKDKITGSKAFYYKYDQGLKIPREYNEPNPYFDRLNKLIDSHDAYTKSIRQSLLKREIISFFERFKKAPFATLKHYLNYLKGKHLRKIFP